EIGKPTRALCCRDTCAKGRGFYGRRSQDLTPRAIGKNLAPEIRSRPAADSHKALNRLRRRRDLVGYHGLLERYAFEQRAIDMSALVRRGEAGNDAPGSRIPI